MSAKEETTEAGMLVTTVATRTHGQTIDLHWSSLAEEPAIWLRIEGGESIDPRDPKRLARLPISNATLLNVNAALDLRDALTAWVTRMLDSEAMTEPGVSDD